MQDRQTQRKQHYKEVERAAWLGLAINFLLGVVKLIVGIIGFSFALIADAINSFSDCLTSIVTIYALRIAQKPADFEHPYGHSRAESIAGSNIAVLIIATALFVAYEAVSRIWVDHPAPQLWVLFVAGGNIVIKEGLYRYKRAVGRRLGSGAIMAVAWDHRADALSSLAVLIGIGIVEFAGEGYGWVDEAAALVVVGIILYAGLKLLRENNASLMDQQAKDPDVDEVRAIAAAFDEVHRVEKVRMRQSGLEYFIELHLHIDPAMSVKESHDLSHNVKDMIMYEKPMVADVVVHIEPSRLSEALFCTVSDE